MMRLYAPFLAFLWIAAGGIGIGWAIPVQNQKTAPLHLGSSGCVRGIRTGVGSRNIWPCRVKQKSTQRKPAHLKIDLTYRSFPHRWGQAHSRKRYRWVVRRPRRRPSRRFRRTASVPRAARGRKSLSGKGKRARALRASRLAQGKQEVPQVGPQTRSQTSLELPGKLPPRFDAKQPSISLQQVFRLVKKNNLDLRLLRERVVQAEIARARAWSILKPQLSLTGSYTRNEFEAAFDPTASIRALAASIPEPIRSQLLGGIGSAEPVVISPQNQLSFRMQLQWAFFNLQSIPILQISYLAVEQVGHTARQVRREILYAAARAYYGILLADGLVDISRRNWSNSRDRLRIAIARYRAGVDPELLVTRAQLDLARARQSWIQAQNGLRNAKLAMALLLNRSSFQFRPLRPSRPALPAGNINDWFALARRNREELKSSAVAIEMAHKQITSAWMQFLPTIAVVGTLQGSNAAGFTGQFVQWSVTLAATMNLYSGGSRYLDVKEAHSKYRQSSLEYAKSRRQILNEISQGRLALRNARVALLVAQKQLGLARRSYQLTQERYKTGVATPVEVSDALTALYSSEIGVLQEALNQELAILSIQRAVGLFRPNP